MDCGRERDITLKKKKRLVILPLCLWTYLRQEIKPHKKFQGPGPSHMLLTYQELTIKIIE